MYAPDVQSDLVRSWLHPQNRSSMLYRHVECSIQLGIDTPTAGDYLLGPCQLLVATLYWPIAGRTIADITDVADLVRTC